MSQAAIPVRSRLQRRPESEAPIFPGKYLSITSFRRDGTGVATPVWFVQDAGRLLVETDASSYKVRRIRHNPSVAVAPCTATGRLLGEPAPARAELLPDSELAQVQRLIARKYRVDRVFIGPIRYVQRKLHLGRPPGKPVALQISPAYGTLPHDGRPG
jgi:uncharacterized protein